MLGYILFVVGKSPMDIINKDTHKEIIAKLEATNNLIKLIKRNAFGLRNFENFKNGFLWL